MHLNNKYALAAARMTVALLVLAAIFSADWLTGYNVSLGPLYLVYVGFFAWRGGIPLSSLAIVGTMVARIVADVLSGHTYPHPWMQIENYSVALVVEASVAAGVIFYQHTLELHRKRAQLLQKLISVCVACGKVAIANGEWATPEELISRPKELYSLCPSCISKQHDAASNPARNPVG